MRALRLTAALLALAALPACSLLGLDKLPQSRCTEDSECASLEAIQPTGDACRTWQCHLEGEDGTCQIETRDDDGDGSPPMMCAMGVAPDCDDMDEARAPTILDACDLVDNDCDGAIDPRFAAVTTRVVTGTTPAPARVLFSAYDDLPILVGAVPPRGTSAALSTGRLSFTELSLTLVATNTSNAEAGVGATGLMRDQSVMAVYDPVEAGGDCGAAGQVEARWLNQAGMSATVLATSCLDQSRLASASVTAEPEGDALLVWVDDAANRECGMTVADAAVNARVLRGFSSGARVDASPVMALGTTTDALGPSVTFVPGQGWIVAHTSSGGDVIVSRIPVTTTLTAYAATMISTIDATMAAEATVTTGDGTTVAVAYTEGGCNATNRVVVRTADVSAASVTFGAELVVTADTTRNRRAPYASRGTRRDEWVVLYREVSDEIAVRLDASGDVVGMPVSLGIGTVAGRPYAGAEGEETTNPGWYFAAATTTGEIYAGTFDCAGTP